MRTDYRQTEWSCAPLTFSAVSVVAMSDCAHFASSLPQERDTAETMPPLGGVQFATACSPCMATSKLALSGTLLLGTLRTASHIKRCGAAPISGSVSGLHFWMVLKQHHEIFMIHAAVGHPTCAMPSPVLGALTRYIPIMPFVAPATTCMIC